jgi:5-methylthioadenosine/S-adenosylhomocysteine deaminase
MSLRTLIQNASIVSMDDAIGEIAGGDILIENDSILEVGRHLPTEGAQVIDATDMVAIPGLVNSHIHTWEIALRGIGADWVGREYIGNMHGNLTHRFLADDNRIANTLGALAQIDGGTTTIFDWCHNLRSADMADGAIDGLEASGIRAVFGHGTAKPVNQPAHERPYYEIPQPAEQVRRLREGRLSSDTALVTMALAILGTDWGSYDAAVADIRLARELGIINSTHAFGRDGQRKVPDGYWRLNQAGLLGPDHNLVHGNCFGDDELKMIIDAGCSVSATAIAEMMNCEKPALLGRVERLGGLPAIGTDVDPYFAASMLAEMRRCFFHQRELDNRMLFAAGRHPPKTHATTTRAALRWATVGGARALQMEDRIGSLTPGKQADVVLVSSDHLNMYPSMPHGDPVHSVVMNAETANVDTVLVAGRVLKRHGKLTFPESRIRELKTELMRVRERVMVGNYDTTPVVRAAYTA